MSRRDMSKIGNGPKISVLHPTKLKFLSNQGRCRLVIRAACCLNLISRLPFRPYCPPVPTCEPHKPLLAKWIWRKRMGVEPTHIRIARRSVPKLYLTPAVRAVPATGAISQNQ